jgi:hypothetical protein
MFTIQQGHKGSFILELMAMLDSKALEHFLLHGDLPSVDLLKQTKLAAYAYTQLPEHHPLRSQLEGDMLHWSLHHLQIKAALKTLFAAWHQGGLQFMAFKGFYLAECVYPQACQRAYNDVDLLVHEQDVAQLSGIAQTLGWLETWREGQVNDRRQPEDTNHEVLHLEHPRFPIRLDIHKHVVHTFSERTDLQERLTRAAWSQAVRFDWEGLKVQTLNLVDHLLFGLVLSRSWSGDFWQLKPHDYLDSLHLIHKGISEMTLKQRAHELGCSATLELFLKRCNPYKKRLDFTPPSRLNRLFYESCIMFERGSPASVRTLGNLRGIVVDAAATFPAFLQAMFTQSEPSRPVRLSDAPLYEWQWLRWCRGVRFWLRALGFYRTSLHQVRRQALFILLCQHGYPVQKTERGLELSGRVLHER